MRTRETMTLGKWYGSSIRIPLFDTYQYSVFAGSCLGIVSSILKKKFDKKIHVRFTNTKTASADQGRGVIEINHLFLKGYFDSEKRQSVEQTLAAIMGIEVHEAAHFAYSPATLKPYVDYIEKKSKKPFVVEIAASLGNIIEDVFIEAEVDRQVPNLSWTLQAINDIMFDEEDAKGRLDSSCYIFSAPSDYQQVAAALDTLILAKTRDSIDTTPWIQELFLLVKTAVIASNIKQRKDLCLAVYNKLMEAFPDVGKNKDGSGQPSELDDGSSQPSYEDLEKLKKALEDSNGLTASKGEPETNEWQSKQFNEKVVQISASEANQTESTFNELNAKEIEYLQPDEQTYSHQETSIVIEETVPFGRLLNMDKRYTKLAEVARQKAVENRPYGLDTQRGHSIRKLYRIATDQKIFAEPVLSKTTKPMQVIILLDMSGSMRMSSVYGTNESRLSAALRAGLGAAVALNEAHCDVAVYGHTADRIMTNSLNIYTCKSFNEPIDCLPARLGYAVDSMPCSSNRDGYALKYVANKFTDPRKKRLIIVVSDGMPWAGDYFGDNAIEHSNYVVEEVRKKGIDVLSISIDNSAREPNDRIYGHKYNVFNTDPNVIEELVKKIIDAY